MDYLFCFDAEGDVVRGGRMPWHLAAHMVSIEGETIGHMNYLIAEGMGEYPSRAADQKRLAETLEIVFFGQAKAIARDMIESVNGSVTAIAWGSRDFPKLGKNFFPETVKFANGIEVWAEHCPTDYDAPKTKTGRPSTTLEDVAAFELAEYYDWHNAKADVEALFAIIRKTISRGANIVGLNSYDDFHRCPQQIAYNRMKG